MKIIMYSVQPVEHKAIEQWNLDHPDVSITMESSPLDLTTVHLAKGFEGVCIQQSASIQDEKVYQLLHEFGIKQIALRTAGFDMINLDYAKQYNLMITNVPAYSPNAIAELALTQTMNLVRKMYVTQPRVAQHDFTWKGLMAPEIRSLTVGVVGVSRIGGVYAKLISGLGARVIGYDVYINEAYRDFVEYQPSLEALLEQADVVSIHAPLLPSTKHMFNAETFKLMKPNAYLINTARGGIVDTEALIEALQTKQIAGAALDTIECEVGYFNQDYSHKTIENEQFKTLLDMENVLITPHIAFFTETAVANMVEIGLDSTYDILTTGTSKNIVK